MNLQKTQEQVKLKDLLKNQQKQSPKKFIRNKHFTWNSGIFLFKASTILEELLKYEPEIIEYCNRSLENSKMTSTSFVLKKNFSNVPILR